MSPPKVSICVPTYNAAATLGETLDSLLGQSFGDFELLVVDNASTDETREIARSYHDPRVRVVEHAENVVGEKNFERCFKLAEGLYTAIFHADDVYERDMVARQAAFLDAHPEAGAVFTLARRIGAAGEDKGLHPVPEAFRRSQGWDRIYDFDTIFKNVLRHHNFLVCPGAMVRSHIYKDYVRVWDYERFGSSGDLGVWLKILERYPIGVLPELLMRYRLSRTQGSTRFRYLDTERTDFFRVIDHYMKQAWVASRLNKTDRRNLFFLELVERYSRAINHLILGNQKEAGELLRGAWSPELVGRLIADAPPWRRSRFRKWWLAGLGLYLISRVPPHKGLQAFLRHLRYNVLDPAA